MNRLIVFLLFFVMLGISPTWADSTNSGATTNTQSNTSGSNTAITGGYSAETTTTYQSGSSSNTTTTNTTNAYSCLLYTSPSPRDMRRSRMPSSA